MTSLGKENSTLVFNCLLTYLLLSVVSCATPARKVEPKLPALHVEPAVPKPEALIARQEKQKLLPVPSKSKHPLPKPQPLPVKRLVPEVSDAHFEEEALDKLVGEDEESVGDSSQEIMHFYYKGYELLKAGKWEEAERNLSHFLEENPTHVYADRAQYLIAQSNFKSKEFHLCVLAVNALEARYPYSLKRADAAVLKIQSLKGMGQANQARDAQRTLARNYPNHPATTDLLRQAVIEPPVIENLESVTDSVGGITAQTPKKIAPPLLEETYE